jgi:hypothetical protein
MALANISSRADDTGWQRLRDWHRAETGLSFVYSRSLGGLVQTGHCRIARLTSESTMLDAAGSKLMVVLAGATVEAAPQLFFTPDLLSHFQVDGVALQLPNHDWLFFSEQAIPEHLQLNAAAARA